MFAYARLHPVFSLRHFHSSHQPSDTLLQLCDV